MTTERKKELLKIFAAVHNRRELEKELAKYRKQFQAAKGLYSITNSKLNDLQAVSDGARQKMEEARHGILNITDSLQTMDLTGSDTTRDRGDVRTYMVDGKEYHVDKSDVNDIKMTPWRKYRDMQKQECMECNDAQDEVIEEPPSDVADADDVAEVAEAYAALCE